MKPWAKAAVQGAACGLVFGVVLLVGGRLWQPQVAAAQELQKQPEDPRGWSKAKWGMSQDEVIRAFDGAPILLPRPNGTEMLTIPHFDLIEHKFSVVFEFDRIGGRLEGVLLDAEEMSIEDPFWNGAACFQSLSPLLENKYGKAERKQTPVSGGRLFEQRWLLASTRLELTAGWSITT